jgi:translation initiation factor IF-2
LAKIKLNIKNTQLAQALQVGKPRITPAAEPLAAEPIKKKTASKKEEELSPEGAVKKRRARIVQPVPEASQIVAEAAPVHEIRQHIPEEKAHIEVSPASITLPGEVVPEAPKAETKPASAEDAKKPPVKSEPAPAVEETIVPRKEAPKELRLPQKRKEQRTFDARDRQGLRDFENEAWRKRRAFKPMKKRFEEQIIVRPKEVSVRLPIMIKDLAHEMKLKSSQLIAKLFMKGITLTLNDFLDDETTVQLLGHDFDCEIKIDTSEQERIQITDRSIRQEIQSTDTGQLVLRPPVVTFMGHVDHGKTSLIDSIRKSNRAASEAGAITQHIGAFKVHTKAGDVTILDTPGHEAFTEMRSRGANVTDIVILVIAGDEGIRAQTDEAIRQAKEAKVPILVALNKCDKSTFDAQKIYRELADRELLPESWGGTTITVNCSAVSGQGIHELLEMIALQAEILELRANPLNRARGTVLESEMHKGLGAVATILVQNGTLRKNDAIVFGNFSGRIKTMQDDYGRSIDEASPSTPVKITGLSELAEAGEEFVVVKSEKEARSLAEERVAGHKRTQLQGVKITSLERMMAKKESGEKKILPVILRADVQGSLEALKNSLLKIQSDKVRLEIVNTDVGEISESDIALAAASKSHIIGFHTRIESHAEDLIKQKNVKVVLHDVIYHLVDEVKVLMKSLLDKIEKENDVGELLVRTVFKSSQLGAIAGCQVTDGIIKRTSFIRQVRNGQVVWKGKIASLKRLKEDIKEVSKGLECGILLDGQKDIREGDILQAYEISYLEQEL